MKIIDASALLRQWRAVLVIAAAVLFLISGMVFTQSGDGDATIPSASLAKETSETSATSSTLVVFTYPEYLALEVLEQFESETGFSVVHETFETVEEMRAQLESNPGRYDLIIADEGTSQDLLHLKLIQPLDSSRFSGLHHLDPRFFEEPASSNQLTFVPYLWGSTIAAYRTDKIDLGEAEQSWSLFWDKRFRNRAAFTSEPSEILALGLAAEGFPLHSRDPSNHEKALEGLRRAILHNGVKVGDSWSNLEQLSTGELWLTHCYSGDAAFFANENENIGYFLPKEGAELWVDGFMLSRDSQQADAAHQFIDLMLRPESSVQCANYAWYLTPNLAALPTLDEELLADEVLNPSAEVLQKCSVVPTLDDRVWHQLLQFGMRDIQEALKTLPGSETSSSPPLASAGAIE